MGNFEDNVRANELASKGKRFANYLIDYIVFYVAFFVFAFLLGILLELFSDSADEFYNSLDNINPILDFLMTSLFYITYYIIVESLFKGRSIGKFITKTKVVMKDRSEPTIDAIIIRSLCRRIPFNAFSFLGNEDTGWHDRLSKTYVVDLENFRDVEEIDLIGKEDVDS